MFFVTTAMEKVLTLTRRKEKVLVVAAVQLMRKIIGTKDDFLVDRVIKQNLLKPVIKAFVENGDRDNMLRSVILELLEYITKENLELLIEYVAESFWDQLGKFEKLPSILAFRLKYKLMPTRYNVQDKGAETKQSSSVVDMSKKADERVADEGQEGYYNKDSDRKDSATPAMHTEEQSMPARRPVTADEALVAGSNPDGGKHSLQKKLKLQDIISSPKSVASANVTGRNSELEDKKDVPHSPSRSKEGSEKGSRDLGDGSPGS